MDPKNGQEPTLEESITQVMSQLPAPIRTYLGEGKYSLVAQELTTTYRLRVDQAGVLEREIMLLIMGVEEPAEFLASLTSDAAVPEETAKKILSDVNQKVFVPLREEMRKTTVQPQAPAPRPLPPQPPVQPSTMTYRPPARPVVAPVPATNGLRSALSSIRPPQGFNPPPKKSINILRNEPPRPTPPSVVPQPSRQPLEVARPAMSPQRQISQAPQMPALPPLPPKTTLPGALPTTMPRTPSVQPGAIQHPPLTPPAPRPVPPPSKDYSVDPYREPIE